MTADRRAQIAAAAAHLFAEHGYAETSMRDIAAAVGMGLGAMYYHIESKEELLARIHEEYVGNFAVELERICARDVPAVDALVAAGELMMRHLHEYRDHMVAFFTEQRRIRGDRFAEVAARRRDVERLLEGLLRRGIAEGALREHDVRLTVLAVLGMFNYGHQWYRPDGGRAPEEIGRVFIDLLLRGVGAGGQRPE
ncbi:MAG TPA: TetR/AcrR family transcriptional regulator [Candidatus Dormibacteraeota bacterium]|nr:TetR/AcrR family transcriptional regulator [Candidatus Dormibacteraeota bacterium]